MEPAIEAEEIHLFDGAICGPAIVCDAIARDENAGAIVAKAAVDEDLFLPAIEKRKKLRDLFICWRRPAADRNVDEANADSFGLFALPLKFLRIVFSEIDNSGDSDFFEFLKAFRMRLGATIKGIADFSCVGKTGDFQFFAKGRRGNHRQRIFFGLCEELRNSAKRKTNQRERNGIFHRRLDAKSLARETQSGIRKNWSVSNGKPAGGRIHRANNLLFRSKFAGVVPMNFSALCCLLPNGDVHSNRVGDRT